MSSAPATTKDYDAHHRHLASQTWGSLDGLVQRLRWAPISHALREKRTSQRTGVVPAPVVLDPLLATARRKRHPVIRNCDGSFRKMSIDDVKKALTTPLIEMFEQGLTEMGEDTQVQCQPLLLLQRSDMKALRTLLQPAGKKHLRAFSVAARQRPSARITVLTDLLREVFWAPEDVDTNDIDEWMAGMGLPADSSGYQAAFDHVLSVTTTSKYTTHINGSEASAIGSAYAGGVRSRNTAYYALTALAEHNGARLALDPIHHRRALLTGVSNRITGHSVGSERWFPITTPFRLREGKRVVAYLHSTDPQVRAKEPANLRVSEVRVAADGSASVRFAADARPMAMLESFVRDYLSDTTSSLSVVLSEQPFASRPPRDKGTGRWLTPTDPTPADRVITRDVPAHIILAGTTD